MAILVTGGAGYIGSHTCIELLQSGYEVIIVDNFSNSRLEALNRIRTLTDHELTYYNMDLLKKDEIEKVFEHHDIEAVIHFAAVKSVSESVAEPLKYYTVNLTGTLNLLAAMEKFHVKKLVFSSTAAVYGKADNPPISEDTIPNATNPYGRTKQMAEQIIKDLAVAHPEWAMTLLRYFNPVGAHASGTIGEEPSGTPSNLMPYLTQVAIGKLPQLQVYGDDYDTPDGTGIRDYIHVTDLAKGHVKALKYTLQLQGAETFNLGTGKGYSVLELINTFERTTGKNVPYKITGRRPGDVAVSFADPSKAERKLNWKAEKGLEEMCADAWRWQQKSSRPGE